ncbi:MAG: aldo/keto reductase [Legionellales bacterium]|nr:aldo/keto reductase [Legionellales bacterium]
MIYENLKNCGLKISKFSLGTYFSVGDRLNYKESKKIVDKAISTGINFIDTSNNYANGKGENYLGRILSDHHHSQYCIGTKVYFPIFKGPNGLGLSKKHIFDSVDQSLKRLRVNYIDILQLHRYDDNTPLEDTVEALNILKTQGKILYCGVSQWNDQQISDSIKLGEKPVCNQIPYNPFYTAFKNNIKITQQNISTIVYGSLAQGVFSEAYIHNNQTNQSRLFHPIAQKELYHNNEKDFLKLKNINVYCIKNNISLFVYAIGFCDITASPTSILLGIYKEEHFSNVVNYLENRDKIKLLVQKFINDKNN